MVLSIRGEKESSWTYSNNTYTDVTLDLGAAAVGDPLPSKTPSSGMDKGIGIEPACLEESSKPRRNKGLKRGVETPARLLDGRLHGHPLIWA